MLLSLYLLILVPIGFLLYFRSDCSDWTSAGDYYVFGITAHYRNALYDLTQTLSGQNQVILASKYKFI